MKLSLYDIRSEITLVIEDYLVSEDRDEQDDLLKQLDELLEAKTDKHESYVHVIRNAESSARELQLEANTFSKRARAHKGLATRLKARLLDDLRHHGEKSVIAGHFKIRRQKSPATVSVDVMPEELPEDYQRVTIEVDKRELLAALKRGEKIPGVSLTQTEHVRIGVA